MDKWKDMNWIELGRRPDITAETIGVVPLMKSLLNQNEGAMHESYEEGSVEDSEKVLEIIKEYNGRLIYNYVGRDGTYSNSIWLWEHGLVEAGFTNDTFLRFRILSENKEFLDEVFSKVKKFFIEKIDPGNIYAIIRNGSNLQLQNIGKAGIPLTEGNYNSKVIEDYKFVVQDLNSSSPAGRIVILEGEPGTGKTHLVRSWLMEVSNAMFVLVSPELVSSLAGPELLPLLLRQKEATNSGPIILVLEDADRCLVTRAGDNINSIQALLNLGDGILGSLLDLRIIATTNAKKLEMEQAILRPGRLSKRIEVGPLEPETALNVFTRLLPEKNVPDTWKSGKCMTLAAVYSVARENGWYPEEEEKDTTEENQANVNYDKMIEDDDD